MNIESPMERKTEEDTKKEGVPFELAIADTPKARFLLFSSELEIGELATWLEITQKASKGFCLSADKHFDSQIEFSKHISPSVCPENKINREAFDLILEIWSKMEPLERNLNIDRKTFVTGTLHRLLDEDIKTLREEKRKVDKISDKYTSALSRYSQLSPRKEQTFLDEEAFQLYEVRRQYVHQTLDYVALLKKIGGTTELSTGLKFLEYMESEFAFFKKMNEVCNEYQPKIYELRAALDKKKEEFTNRTAAIENQVIRLKEMVVTNFKPLLSNQTSESSLFTHKRTTKEGYLWKKLKAGIPKWERRYFSLSNQTLSYRSFTPERGIRGYVITNNIGTCILRSTPSEKNDRRYCFEIETNQKQQFLLQAENEIEYRDWLATIENAQANQKGMQDVSLETRSFEENETNASKKNSVVMIPGSFRYPQPIFEEKNKLLHYLLKSIPLNDYVFDACVCTMHKEVPLQGKLFVTQNRIVFHSSIMKIVTAHIIYISEINAIETNRKEGVLQKNLEIHTSSQKYVFSLRKSNDFDLREVIIKIWMWHKDNKEKTEITTAKVQEFYDSLYKSYIRSNNKEDGDSSGSEDEPEAEKNDNPDHIPSDFVFPTSEVSGEVEPLPGEVLINEVFSLPAQKINSIIFDQEDPLRTKFMQMRKYLNMKHEPWVMNADGLMQRTIDYLTPMNIPMVKATSTEASELQIYLKRDEYIRYVIDVRSNTPNAPYGDCFEVHLRYIITFVSKTSARLHLSLNVDWKKSTRMKSVVQRGVTKGCQGMSKDLMDFLKKEAKGKGSSVHGHEGHDLENETNGGADASNDSESSKGGSSKNKNSSSLPLPLPLMILVGLLLFSVLLNVTLLLPSRSKSVSLPRRNNHTTSLVADLSRIVDIGEESFTWTNLEQKLQEKSYAFMKNDLRGFIFLF